MISEDIVFIVVCFVKKSIN